MKPWQTLVVRRLDRARDVVWVEHSDLPLVDPQLASLKIRVGSKLDFYSDHRIRVRR